MSNRKTLQPQVLRILDSPAYITAEQHLVDVVKQSKAHIQIEVATVMLDLMKQVFVVKPLLSYRDDQGQRKQLATEHLPMIAIPIKDIGDSVFDLCEKLTDIGLEHLLESLVDNKVFGIETMDDYTKE